MTRASQRVFFADRSGNGLVVPLAVLGYNHKSIFPHERLYLPDGRSVS